MISSIDPNLVQLLRGILQISAAVVAATSLWGAVLMLRDKFSKHHNPHVMELIRRMLLLFIPALIVFLLSWWYGALYLFPLEAYAHEGIVIKPTFEAIQNGFAHGAPWVCLLMIVSTITFSFYLGECLKRHRKFEKWGGWLLLTQFILMFVIMFILMAYIVWTGLWDARQFFFTLHSLHSILTLGTVLTVDFLYIISQHHSELKKIVYRFFPIMSGAIWIGLGIDFLSVSLIFNEAFHVTTQLIFTQTVIGILVLNGALLSGRINKMLKNLIHRDRVLPLSPRYKTIFGVSGAISITSWLTIYILDFVIFKFTYIQFLGIYLTAIATLFLIHHFLDETAFKKI